MADLLTPPKAESEGQPAIDVPAALAERPLTPSPDEKCAICLGKRKDETRPDCCSHLFCYECIVEWCKYGQRPFCPLCKSAVSKLFHGNPSVSVDVARCRSGVTTNESFHERRVIERAIQDLSNQIERIGHSEPRRRRRGARQYADAQLVEHRQLQEFQQVREFLAMRLDQLQTVRRLLFIENPPQRGQALFMPAFRRLIYERKLVSKRHESEPYRNIRFTPRLCSEDVELYQALLMPWIKNELMSIPHSTARIQSTIEVRNTVLDALVMRRMDDEVINQLFTHTINYPVQSPDYERIIRSYKMMNDEHIPIFTRELYDFACGCADPLDHYRTVYYIPAVNERPRANAVDLVTLSDTEENAHVPVDNPNAAPPRRFPVRFYTSRHSHSRPRMDYWRGLQGAGTWNAGDSDSSQDASIYQNDQLRLDYTRYFPAGQLFAPAVAPPFPALEAPQSGIWEALTGLYSGNTGDAEVTAPAPAASALLPPPATTARVNRPAAPDVVLVSDDSDGEHPMLYEEVEISDSDDERAGTAGSSGPSGSDGAAAMEDTSSQSQDLPTSSVDLPANGSANSRDPSRPGRRSGTGRTSSLIRRIDALMARYRRHEHGNDSWNRLSRYLRHLSNECIADRNHRVHLRRL